MKRKVLEPLVEEPEKKRQKTEESSYDNDKDDLGEREEEIDNSSILEACRLGNMDLVKKIIEYGMTDEEKDKNIDILLLVACKHGHLELAKYLVEKGSSIDYVDEFGFNCLLMASYHSHLELIKYFLDIGCDINQKDYEAETSVMYACANGNFEICKYLVEKGCTVTDSSIEGGTCFLYACGNGHLEMAKYLLNHGSSLYERNFNFSNCVLCACGRLDMLKYLVEEKGCSLASTNIFGTCIMNAAMEKHVDVVVWMLNNGCSLDENTVVSVNNGHVITSDMTCQEILKKEGIFEEVRKAMQTKSSRK